jgi:colanic acid biosynthesis glycosyl transferase WcaI
VVAFKMLRQHSKKEKCIWILSDIFFPVEVSTGHFMTQIACKAASVRKVIVLTTGSGPNKLTCELSNGGATPIVIRRLPLFPGRSRSLAARAIRSAVFGLYVLICGLFQVGKGDKVLAVTNPPILPLVGSFIKWARGAELVTLVHDVYPDILVVLGIVSKNGIVDRVWRTLQRFVFYSSDTIVVIGRDMGDRVARYLPSTRASDVVVIPNWADDGDIYPLERRSGVATGCEDKSGKRFRIQYSGNAGRTHDLETIVKAYDAAKNNNLVLEFVGDRIHNEKVVTRVRTWAGGEIRFRERCDRSQLCESLNSCDAAIVALVPGMVGLSVPSRCYNILSAGKPLIAVVDEQSEIARIIKEHQLGWTIRSGDVVGLASVFEGFPNCDAGVRSGREIRRVLMENWSSGKILEDWSELLARSNKI